ncbi:hypothetical protein [Kribbella sp. NPDC004875]|uniref:hypothetical protein n=1 Tax=Kribbella sp. NPDC004875 TaxID=3364107 RepID=UPI0036BF1985
MPKLTDDELGTLLRETFSAREQLTDQLPETTEPSRRRSAVPILLAAAAVLAVLAGVLYGVSRVGAGPTQPAATPTALARTATDDARIWAVGLDSLLQSVKPDGGWRSVIVMDLSDVGKDHLRKGPPIAPEQRTLISELVSRTAPITYHGEMSPAPATCDNSGVGVAQLRDVIDKGDHAEVEVNLYHDCTHWTTAKYRVERQGVDWVITQTFWKRTVR